MPSITRRRLIAGSTAVAAIGYGGYRLANGAPDANFDSWTPDAGTWPLTRYDTANTAHNPHADPPRELPDKRKLGSVASRSADPAYFFPLADPDSLVLCGDELAAYHNETISPLGDTESYFVGFTPDGRLHATSESGTDTTIVGYAGDQETYRHPVSGHPKALTIGRDEIYVGTLNDGVLAYEPDGGRNWVVDGATCALADDRLYTVG